MIYDTYSPNTVQPSYPLVFLVPSIRKPEIKKEYLDPLNIDPDSVLLIQVHQDRTKKKTAVKDMKEWVETELFESLEEIKAQYVFVADAEYFKLLAGVTKADALLGYVKDSKFGNFKVVYIPNYRTVFHDPVKIRPRIKQALQAVADHVNGVYSEPGTSIIGFAVYPKTDEEIQEWLTKLLDMDVDLAIDIEAFSLKHYDAGIGTITFCWSKTEGIAFPVDYVEDDSVPGFFGKQVRNEKRRQMLRLFFMEYVKTAHYHHISYDVTVLIYQLFMKDLLDTKGLLFGMNLMLGNWHDTKLITYLATNSCAGNDLSLKTQAQEYAGNYAVEEIKDIRKIPLDKLLEYNLVDGLSTWFTKEKHYNNMIADEQGDIYRNLFQPAIKDIVQMQLTGIPLNMKRVEEVEVLLQADQDKAEAELYGSEIVQEFVYGLKERIVLKKNAGYKKKVITVDDVDEDFNPRSPIQLQTLLFKQLGLPVLGLTKTKQPSTDADVLKDMKNHTKDEKVLKFLNALIDYKSVEKILGTFIPAMKLAPMGPDGWHYLFGNFNLGGTVSGRLSGSDPNLQTLPANSKYAAYIKSCIEAPPGWLWCGLDFASLEDKISGLTTKDPEKLKVYTDGFDGHSLRTYTYFAEQMPDIQMAESADTCYKANVSGTDVYFTAKETVEYLGKTMLGKELYELFTRN